MVDKHVVVEVDDDGMIVAVYCPDETYVVDVLDRGNWHRDVDQSLDTYYQDVEDSTKDLKNCY